MKALGLSFLIVLAIQTSAQDIHYAQTVIDLLTAPDMHGRGYVEEGHKKAANYISSEFKTFGLQSLSPNYQQPFPLQVNTFPRQMLIKVDNQKLIPGHDFIIDPSSSGIKGKYDVLNIRLDTLLRNTSDWVKAIKKTNKVISLNKSGYSDLPKEDQSVIDGLEEVLRSNTDLLVPAIVILEDAKFTWGTSRMVAARPIFKISLNKLKDQDISVIRLNIKNEYFDDYYSQNVIGQISGRRADSIIIISAHYDHLGRMGKGTYFPGANDNASGVAMMLNLARHFSFIEKPEYTLLFIAFGGEEAGLIGSQYYVNRPFYPLSKVKFIVNLDIVGTGSEGITVVNGKIYGAEFNKLVEINNTDQLLIEVKSRGAACNSDHCSFDQHNVPGFFIYTRGGIQAYHDVNDRYATLPLTEFEDLFKLIRKFVQPLE